MKVLIIDDEQNILDLYSEQFRQDGIVPLVALSGEQGISIAKAQKPDIILLDIIMPRLNGLDVLYKIKNDPLLQDTPIYLLTNLPEETSGEKAKELGAAGYFVKVDYEPHEIAQKLLGAGHDNKLPR